MAAFTPRGEYAPIDPPEPAVVELAGARLIDGDGLAPTAEQLDDWANNWIDTEGYDECIAHAEALSSPDPDDARDAARDAAFDPPSPEPFCGGDF